MPPSPAKSGKARRPFGAFDKLLEKAFAPRDAPTNASLLSVADLKRPMAPEPPPTPLTPAFEPDMRGTQQNVSLTPVWTKVRQSRERELGVEPSKVKSIQLATPDLKSKAPAQRHGKHILCADIKVSSKDDRMIVATFDVPGVKREDMHVSFRAECLIVSWQTIKVADMAEGGILVRNREVIKQCQIIPLPEGTKFEDIRASRNGHRLLLTYPNGCCIPVRSNLRQPTP